MRRSLVLLVLLLSILPTAASADDSLTRSTLGHGRVLASSSRAPAPGCTTPEFTREGDQAGCDAIPAASFGTCTDFGRHRECEISVTAEPPNPGWEFRRWSRFSTRCPNATNPVCTFTTRQIDCDASGEHCTVTDPGPFFMIAEFANVRAPTVTLRAGPTENRTVFDDARQATFEFVTDEPGERPTFQCRRDGGPPAPCAPPHTLRDVPDGVHTFCVTATDVSGRASVAPACRTWRQETTPTAQLLTRPPAASATGQAAFTYSSNKAGRPADGATVSFTCRLDAGAFAACPDDGVRLAQLRDGRHEFSVRAVLRTADAERTSAAETHNWTVDTVPPQTAITSGPPDGATIVDVAPTLAFSADEPATFTCAVDGGGALPCASPFTTPALSAGTHSVAIAATDAVGNVDPTPATVAFTLVTGLATLLDADGDGIPETLDCDDRAAGVRPGALEVPGNAVDENCDGVRAPFARVPSVIAVGGTASAKRTRFTRLLVTGVPNGGTVQLRCSGPRRVCPFTRRALRVAKRKANAIKAKRSLSFGVGATVEVRVTAPNMIGKVRRLRIVARRFPRGQDLCLSPTSSVPRRCTDRETSTAALRQG